jgi:drug/metabolite transporter (DMT)-like permease
VTIQHAILASISVVAMSLSQLLFKRAGVELQLANTWFSTRPLLFTWVAFVVSGSAMLLWINVLRHVPLSRAHAFMALSFFIVPISSYLVYRETISAGYLAGLMMVLGGLAVIVRFG